MQNLPYPTVRHDLREAVRAAGYESLPSQSQLSEQAYVLLGAQHLAAFPVRLNQRLVPRNIHQKFPQLHLFESSLNSEKMVGGTISKGRKYIQHQFISEQADDDEEESHEEGNHTSGIWRAADSTTIQTHLCDDDESSMSSSTSDDDDDDDDDDKEIFFTSVHQR